MQHFSLPVDALHEKESEHDHEITQSQTADQPTALLGRAKFDKYWPNDFEDIFL